MSNRKKQDASKRELERLHGRIRHLESRLVAADKALEDGVKLSDLSDKAVSDEVLRHHADGAGQCALGDAETADGQHAGSSRRAKPEGPYHPGDC